jgi:catechol 2,3-dioxygenase
MSRHVPKLNHLGIYVYDLERMVDFYQSVFGLVVTDRGPGKIFKNDLVFMSGDPQKHHQLVLVSGRTPDTPSTVMQISFIVEELAELKDMNDKLKKLNIAEITSLNHGNAWSIYFSDPEGNKIEVYTDTPFYTPQPCGEPLDLSLPDAVLLEQTKMLVAERSGGMSRKDYVDHMTKVLG